jgi:hypothetical protein
VRDVAPSFCQHRRHVTFHGAQADAELGRHLPVGKASGEQGDHIGLSWGERPGALLQLSRSVLPLPNKVARERLAQHEDPVGHGAYRVDELPGGGGL